MDRSMRSRNRTSNNLRLKASSLYFLNDISNIDSTDSLNTMNNWRDEYTFNPNIIGRGHFSKVYKVKCCSTGNTLAIKVVRRKRLGSDKIDEIMQEIEIMQLLNKSSNVGFIQLVKVHTSPSEVGIVMEFASGGSLYHVTQDSKTGLPEVYVRIILTKFLSALCVLHRQDIVHLDIKADNILLRYPYPSTDVVLTDFGLARKLTKFKVHKEMIGTPDYIAPEVANYEQICLNSDMWSVGVLSYFLLTNVSPFSGISKDDTLHKVTKTQFDFVGKLTEENMLQARMFISSLLVKIPENRLTSDGCLLHEFLSNVDIIECSPEKSVGTEAPVFNFNYEVQVRNNPGYRTRGLVMSQYDIDSSHYKHNMMDSEEDLLKVKSVEALDIRETSDIYEHNEETVTHMEVSVHSIDQITEDFNEIEVPENEVYINEDLKELEEIQPRIENKSKSNTPRNSMLNDKEEEEDEETESTTNVQLVSNHFVESDGTTQDLYSSNTDNGDNSLSEMTTSCFETSTVSNQKESDNGLETSTSESYSVLIKDEKCKENDKQNEDISDEVLLKCNNFHRTEIYDSRRRCNGNENSKSASLKCSRIAQSFRNSRENILDYNHNNKDQHLFKSERINSFNTIDSREFDSLRSANGLVKRRNLVKSIKKDSDKPHNVCDWNRRSEIIMNTDDFEGLPGEEKRSISASHGTLDAPANNKHNKKGRQFLDLFKSKKSNEPTKSKRACIIS